MHITANVGNFGNFPIPAGSVQLEVILENPDTSGMPPQQASLKTLIDGAPLNAPHGGVFDGVGNLYVANASERKVYRIQPGGQISVFASISTTNAPSALQDLAFDKGGNLLVLTSYGRIVKIAPDGVQTLIDTGLAYQYGVDVDNGGNIYITGTNADGNALLRIDPAGTKSILVSNGLSTPTGAVFDGAGNLYVSNYGDNTIAKIAPGGKIIPFVRGLNRPQGITMDGQGNFFVANSGANNVLKITPDGAISIYATGFSNPYELRFDASGNLFVTNNGNSTVYKVDASGVVSVFAKSAANRPEGMKYDAAGNLYIANGGNNTLTRLDANGNVSLLSTALSTPRGMAVSATGEVYVANYSSASIVKFSGGTTSTVASGLKGPWGLSMDAGNNLYVAEYSANRIAMINAAGQKRTVADSLVNEPQEVLIDSSGTQYLLNSGFISVFDGTNAGSILVKGFYSAQSFAFAPGGGFYVLDYNYFLKKIDANGVLVSSKTISYSRGGLVADGAGNVFVTDYNNRTIVRINSSGVSRRFTTLPYYPDGLISDGANGFYAHLTNGQIVRVDAAGAVSSFATVSGSAKMALDGSGKLYVTINSSSNNINIYDPSGILLKTLSGPQSPSGIAVNAAGQMMVAETSQQQFSTYDNQGVLVSSFNGFSNPKDLVWNGTQVIFADSNGRIYALTPGQKPQTIASISTDYLAWNNGVLYFTNSSGVHSLQANGAVTYFSAPGISALSGLALRGDGTFSFGMRDDSRVVVLNAVAQISASYAGLSAPQGLAVDASGNLLVSNAGLSNIVQIAPSGKQAQVFAQGIAARGLAFDATGQLFATGSNSVYKLSPAGTVTSLASGGSSTNGLATQGGSVYVTDSSVGAVRVVNGNKLNDYAFGLGGPYGVRVGADGAVYVAGKSSGVVTRYGGGALSSYASGLTNPQALAFDAAGNLYVGGSAGSLTMIGVSGRKTEISSAATLLSGKAINGLAFNAANTLYLTASTNKTVYTVELPAPQFAPPAGTVAYTAMANIPGLALDGATVPLDFGTWKPAYGGDYSVRIAPAGPAVDGVLANGIHVGPSANGAISANKTALTPGQNTLGVNIKLKGADFTTLSKVDTSNLAATVSTQSVYPKSMPADRAGNIYLSYTNVIKRITPRGQMSDFVSLPGALSTSPIAIDSQENLYVAASTALNKIMPDGSVSTLTSLPSAPLSLVVDSRDTVLALLANRIIRIAQDGTQTNFTSSGVTTPYGMTIDGRDNVYVQNQDNLISKITPDGSATVLLSRATGGPFFEYEGINVAGDCADNVFLTPISWSKVGQTSGEEHTLVQIVGRTGQVASILNGYDVKPQITDMDFVAYDRFSSKLFIWTDSDHSTYTLPVTCGAIGVDLHMVLPQGQSASGFNMAPSGQISLPGGSTEYVWNLKDVTALGQDVRFDTVLSGLKLGEIRPVASDAYLVFKNSFVPGEVRVPLEIPTLGVDDLVGLAVSADQPEYPVQTNTGIVVDFANANSSIVDGTLKVDIFDAQGVLVKNVVTQPVSVPASAPLSVSLEPPFNTGDTIAGIYTVKAELIDVQGTVIAHGTTSFKIVAGSGGATLNSTVSVDKLVYSPLDTVNIKARVSNLASNQLLDNLSVSETVTDAAGVEAFSGSQAITQLTSGAFRDLNFPYALKNAVPGIYTVQQKVSDSTGAILDSKSTSFTVQSSAITGAGVTGTLSVAPKQLLQGDPLVLSYSTANQGNADITALPITLTIIDPASQTVVTSWAYTPDILLGNKYQGTQTWSSAGGTVGVTYVAVLSASLGGKTLTLAQDNFTVVEPPVKLDIKQQLLREGRLLVLLSCKNGEGDSHKRSEQKSAQSSSVNPKSSDSTKHWECDRDDDQTCIDARAGFLDDALTAIGIDHRISATLADFKQAYRSGQYNIYWLSGGALKLDNDLAQELRESVNRGDGLLLDGIHDERNGLLDEIVGVRYRGKLSTLDQTMTLSGPLFTPGATVPTLGRPLKLVLDGGMQHATYPATLRCDDCDDERDRRGATPGDTPAIVSNAYGKGRGIVMAFDLLGILTQSQPLAQIWQDIMQASFGYLMPPVPDPQDPQPLTAGAYAAVRTTLTNQSQAVALEIASLLPPGAAVVSAKPQALVAPDNSQAKWNLNLAVAQSTDLTLALRVPKTQGGHTLTTTVDSIRNGQSKRYGSYPLTLDVTPAMDTAATGKLIADLQALSFTASRDREARNQAVKALQDAITKTAQGKTEDAIEKLLDAIDKLRRIGSRDMSTYRLAVDRWLQELELQWLDATLTVQH